MHPEALEEAVLNALRSHSVVTQRERIATACLQGLLASGQYHWSPSPSLLESATRTARVAVQCADALIEELDK